MNENHAQLCPSPGWAAHIPGEVLPYLVGLAPLDGEMLEVGPGPGAATDWLRHHVSRLVAVVAVEVDASAAAALASRFAGSNVEVQAGDATDLAFAEGSFDAVGTFTMLNHVPTAALQRRVLSEPWRVLRDGGTLLGSDSLASDGLHHFHAADTDNPVDPATVLVWLRAIGFARVTVTVGDDVRFVAVKFPAEPCGDAD